MFEFADAQGEKPARFVVAFTLYTAVRLFTYPDAGAPAGRAGTL